MLDNIEISSESVNMKKNYIKYDDELYARLVTRRISSVFTKLMLIMPLSANQITIFDIFLGLLAAVFFAFGNYYLSISGALMLQLWYVFDCVDGEVARAKYQMSPGGVFLDYIGHDLVQPAVFVGIGFGVFYSKDQIFLVASNGNLWLLFMAFTAAYFSQLLYNPRSNIIRTAMSMLSGKMKEKDCLAISMVKLKETKSDRPKVKNMNLVGRLKALYRKTSFMFTYPFIMNLLFFAAIFGLLAFVVAFYGVILPLLWLFSVYSGYKYEYGDGRNLEFYYE